MIRLMFLLAIIFIFGIHDRCYADLYMYIDENGSIFFTDAPIHGGYVRIKKETKRADKQGDAKVRRDRKFVKKNSNTNTLYENIKYEAQKYNIDPDLVWAIIKMESNFNSEAVSPKGAVGLMQLMPATAKAFDVPNPFNPHQNIEGGIRYLRYLLMMFDGDLNLSLAAYNAGENIVLYYRDIPPFSETENYVRKVLSFYRYLKNSNSSKFIRSADVTEQKRVNSLVQD